MLKAYKYRLLPTEDQKIWFDGLFRACRFIYNLGLEVKSTAWKSAKINVSGYELNKQITELRNNECTWLKEYPAQCFESEMGNLDAAFKTLFRGGGYPNFKRRFGRQSASFRQNTFVAGGKVKLTRIGWVDFIEHRKLPEGEIRTAVVSKETTGNFFVSILVKDNEVIPNKRSIHQDTAIGIDVGIKTFAVLSDGTFYGNPKYLKKEQSRLRIEQKKLSRRFRRGASQQSKGYLKQKLIVAKLHEKISNKRADFLHKTSTEIVNRYDTICVESLNIKGMQQNRKLAKSISDASWYEFIKMLQYKAEWEGKNLIKIGMFQPSSKTCSDCGHVHMDLELSERNWQCSNCGSFHNRDYNAAKNIKKIGLEAKPSIANVTH